MTDAHGPADDPNAAPLHQDVRFQFATWQVVLSVLLGLGAIAAGIITGLIYANT